MERIINVTENGQTFIAEVHTDMWDNERIVCSLWDVGSLGGCVSVGDGSCGESALEDALWDALGECAHARHVAAVEALRAELSTGIALLRVSL
jgi:hypothetical protein